jgi:hypothetical protein
LKALIKEEQAEGSKRQNSFEEKQEIENELD